MQRGVNSLPPPFHHRVCCCCWSMQRGVQKLAAIAILTSRRCCCCWSMQRGVHCSLAPPFHHRADLVVVGRCNEEYNTRCHHHFNVTLLLLLVSLVSLIFSPSCPGRYYKLNDFALIEGCSFSVCQNLCAATLSFRLRRSLLAQCEQILLACSWEEMSLIVLA